MTFSRHYTIACVAVVVLACTALLLWYAPEHCLRPFDGKVTMDGKPVRAYFYIGNPTDNEADAFVLVHAPECGDYILNFGDENYREISDLGFMRLPFGAWTFHSMRKGPFSAPLPFQNLNEFRIRSRGGHLVTIAF